MAIHLSGNVDGVVRFLEANGASNISARDDYIEAYVPVLCGWRKPLNSPESSAYGVIQPPESNRRAGSGIAGNGPGVHGSAAWNQAGFTGEGYQGRGNRRRLWHDSQRSWALRCQSDVHARCYTGGWGSIPRTWKHCGDEHSRYGCRRVGLGHRPGCVAIHSRSTIASAT